MGSLSRWSCSRKADVSQAEVLADMISRLAITSTFPGDLNISSCGLQ
jgi:hypothetical protein